MATIKTRKKPAAPANPKPSAPGLLIVRLELTPDGKDRVQAVADRFGMTQIATLSRLVEWFSGQPEAVQQAVLAIATGQAGADGVARAILGRMAAGK